MREKLKYTSGVIGEPTKLYFRPGCKSTLTSLKVGGQVHQMVPPLPMDKNDDVTLLFPESKEIEVSWEEWEEHP